MGRRKIEIKMVNDRNLRQVTFSKRRKGLFKKANELSILCGAEVAIVVISPGNKAFCFGNPGVEVVAQRFLHQEPKSKGGDNHHGGSKVANIEKLNQRLAQVMEQLRVEEKEGEMLDEAIKLCASEIEASSSLLLLAQKPVHGKGNHLHVAQNA